MSRSVIVFPSHTGNRSRRIAIRQFAQKLLLGKFVARRPVSPDADTQNSRATSFALRLKHRIENGFTTAIQIAVGVQLFVRQGILRADIFAAAAF